MKELKIYLKPHIRKFVLKHHPGKEPIVVTERSTLGMAIAHALQDDRKYKFDRLVNHYTSELRIHPHKVWLRRSPRGYKLVKVNIELERRFKEVVLVWVSAQVFAGVPASTSCKDFMAYYGLDENDITFEGIHKIWTRSLQEEKDIISRQTGG